MSAAAGGGLRGCCDHERRMRGDLRLAKVDAEGRTEAKLEVGELGVRFTGAEPGRLTLTGESFENE